MTEHLQRRIEEALHQLLGSADHVSASQLHHAAIPEGLRHFLVRSIERRIHLETHEALSSMNPWIDADHESVHAAANQSAEMLFQTARYPAKDWKRASAQAVSSLLEYLQEPARALAEFAYPSGVQAVLAHDVRRRTGYFCDYPYMARAVDAWLEQRASDMVDRSAFEAAMRHLDARMTDDHETDEWIDLLQPMVDLVTYAGVEPVGLPVSMVCRFFEAKDRPALASLITSAAAVHRAEMITVPSLREIIEKGLENERLQGEQPASPDEPASAPQTPGADASPDSQQSDASAPSSEGNGGRDDQPLPLWKRFQQRADTKGAAASASDAERAEDSGQPLWKSFESPSEERTAISQSGSSSIASEEEPDSRAVPDIPVQEAPRLESQHIVLGTAVRSRERFIRALFDNDEAAYTEAMDDLVEAPDWSSASSIIADRIFKPYRIDIYSDVAVDFTNAVEARYSGMPS